MGAVLQWREAETVLGASSWLGPFCCWYGDTHFLVYEW